MRYVGHLSREDPLFGYLQHDILPLIGVGGTPDFRVHRLTASKEVYLYEDKHSHARVIGKFFNGDLGRSRESARRAMEQEYKNLETARRMGFAGYPHYISRPLGHNAKLNCVLVSEYCYGTPLHEFMTHAIRHGSRKIFFQKLTALAFFLATFHNRSANGLRIDFNPETSYFDHVTNQLQVSGQLAREEAGELCRLRDEWRRKDCVRQDQQVLVHGDVSPVNILFGEGLWVIAFDMERMRPADRVFDVGRMCGEIKHYCMQYGGNKGLAEPFIGHFLWEYACHFPDRRSAFDSITRRVPFYMGLALLSIARNAWLPDEYRKALISEAKNTLR